MSKTNSRRPIMPCWYCQSIKVVRIGHAFRFGDVRDADWYQCAECLATAQRKPTSLGPGPRRR